jgi:hypothetical protein
MSSAAPSLFIADVKESFTRQQISEYLKHIVVIDSLKEIIWMPGYKQLVDRDGHPFRVKNVIVHAVAWCPGTEEVQRDYHRGKYIQIHFNRFSYWKVYQYKPKTLDPRPKRHPTEPTMFDLNTMDRATAIRIYEDLKFRIRESETQGFEPHPDFTRHFDLISGWLAHSNSNRRENEFPNRREDEIRRRKAENQRRQEQLRRQQEQLEKERRQQEQVEREQRQREQLEREQRQIEEDTISELTPPFPEEEEDEEEEEDYRGNYHSQSDIPEVTYEDYTKVVYEDLPALPPQVKKNKRTFASVVSRK